MTSINIDRDTCIFATQGFVREVTKPCQGRMDTWDIHCSIQQSASHCSPLFSHFHIANIWIKIIQVAIQIECLHGTK